MSLKDLFYILHEPAGRRDGPVVFSIVKNETYFLPHFLAHYRKLGIREFWFLDDHSTDGTRDFIAANDDCGILASQYTFSDMIDGKRFVVALRNAVPGVLFPDRWVLTVDADEFLVMPSQFSTIQRLTEVMEENGLETGRGLMVDFYPSTLSELDGAPCHKSPFEISPNYDVLSVFRWEDGKPSPSELSYRDSVRPRMFFELRNRGYKSLDSGYRFATLNKVPLIRWRNGTEMLSVHRCNIPVSDKLQLALAHFKFYPDYLRKIRDAVGSGAYWNNSIEYQFLDIASRELAKWSLTTDRSRIFSTPLALASDLETAGVVWSNLGFSSPMA